MRSSVLQVPFPDEVLLESGVSEQHAIRKMRQLFVIDLYKHQQITSGKGAEILGIRKYDFIQLLSEAGVNYFNTYEVERQGLINYSNRVHNQRQVKYLRYLWETSLLKTFANKYQTTVSTIIRRYRTFLTGEGRALIGVEIPRSGKKPLQAVFW